MSLRRLSYLQWFGLLGGGLAWYALYLAGVGTSQATCNPAGARWGVPYHTVLTAVTALGAAIILAAELAAVAVFRATRDFDEEDPPPHGRLHFFAVAAMVGNVIFLGIILLAGVGTLLQPVCHQA